MTDSGTWIEIVLLAMLAGFIGLRLVSVLGRRTGHEKPVGEPFRPGAPELSKPVSGAVDAPTRAPVASKPLLQFFAVKLKPGGYFFPFLALHLKRILIIE